MSRAKTVETRAGVELTNLGQPLFDGADATKRDLVDYLDAVRDRILPELRQRPLSVIRIRPGQEPFMQKNVPKYTPDWVETTTMWAEASRREVRYALADDRRTLLWFANQRSVEYHPALMRVGEDHPTYLILDLDPPEGDDFAHVVRAARLVHQALADSGLAGALAVAGDVGGTQGEALALAAKQAFVDGLNLAALVGSVVVFVAAFVSWKLLPRTTSAPFVSLDRDDDPALPEAPALVD